MWQDYSFTVCSILFGYSLIPQVIKNYKSKDAEGISWQLCFVSIAGLIVGIITCLSLRFYFTSIINAIQIILWSLIIYQKVHYVIRRSRETNLHS